jgi:hypothetical protein
MRSTRRRRATVNRRALLAVAGGLVMSLLNACTPAEPQTSYRVATFTADVSGLSRLEGTLAGEANADGTACLWIGEGTNRMLLVWPHGYSASGSTLRVVDQAGQIRATVGKRVAVGGRRDDRPGVSVQGCTGVGEPWLVGEVKQLDK